MGDNVPRIAGRMCGGTLAAVMTVITHYLLALATFMARLDSYIVNVSLPTMARYFDSSLSDTSRVVFVYILAASNTLLLFSKWVDRARLRRISF